ncbi:sulfotransferase family 2 domain-containing protein [Candidatus Albibeggiatoa sp. nov. BB20]|uniref:sulfotransferase family 2 domain-containing protein n=1 Tax=Candidatus Albibeggiatoa sp. nov. BB20 TaxID=3162723 RepID=UPI003365629C
MLNSQNYITEAENYAKQDDIHTAIGYYRKALFIEKSQPASVYIGFANCLYANNELKEAEQIFLKLLNILEDKVDPLIGLAKVAEAHQNWGQALQYLERCIEHYPQHPQYSWWLHKKLEILFKNLNLESLSGQKLKSRSDDKNKLDKNSQQVINIYKLLAQQHYFPSANPYNLTISHEQHFVWFRVAKVATRSMYNYLLSNNITLDVEHCYNLHYPINTYQDYYKFAFVRNPWDRLASCWFSKIINGNHFNFDPHTLEKMQSFEHFVSFVASLDISSCDSHLRLQSRLIDLNQLDYLGRFETLQEDITHVFHTLDIPLENFGHENQSKSKGDYRQYYNDITCEKVSKIYKKDIQIFGYQFDN